MIHAAVQQLASGLDLYLRRTFARSEERVVVSNLLEQDGSPAPHTDNKIVVCR